jgi:hypothetical protein
MWENSRRVDFVGWDFDLDTRRMSLSQKNHYKAVYYFFMVNTRKAQSLHTMQALASRETRYATVCRHMRPFTAAFYAMTTQYGNSQSAMRKMSVLAVMDVQMWRAFLCLLAFDERNYARSIESFRVQVPLFRIEYDASLTGLGIVISKRGGMQQDWTLVQYLGMQFPFTINGDSSYQNTCEFLAMCAGVFAIWLSGEQHFTYELIGDSMSSLKWSRSAYTKSCLARNSSIGLSLIAIKADAWLNWTTHIPGKQNIICDGLSRDCNFSHESLPVQCKVDVRHVHKIMDFLLLCDPTV